MTSYICDSLAKCGSNSQYMEGGTTTEWCFGIQSRVVHFATHHDVGIFTYYNYATLHGEVE